MFAVKSIARAEIAIKLQAVFVLQSVCKKAVIEKLVGSMDKITKQQRSVNMASIHSKGNKTTETKFAEQLRVELVYAVAGAMAISETTGTELEVKLNCPE